MRVDLNVPFAEKDEAKSLGAWWDPARRTWFVKNAEDLTPFQRWFKKQQSSSHEVAHVPATSRQAKKAVMRAAKARARREAPRTTQSAAKQHCGCYDVAPWDHCEHTAGAA